MALNVIGAKTPWLAMPVSKSERGRWRPIPVAEIAALHARIAELEAAARKATRRRSRRS